MALCCVKKSNDLSTKFITLSRLSRRYDVNVDKNFAKQNLFAFKAYHHTTAQHKATIEKCNILLWWTVWQNDCWHRTILPTYISVSQPVDLKCLFGGPPNVSCIVINHNILQNYYKIHEKSILSAIYALWNEQKIIIIDP